MALNFLDTIRASALAVATGAIITGCGGGGASGEDSTSTTQSAVTSTTTQTSTSSADLSTDAADASIASTATNASSTSENLSVATAATSPSTIVGSVTATGAASGLITVPAETAPTTTVATNTASSTGGSTGTVASTKSSRSGAGINLASMDYYSANMPTFDLMKKAGPWLTQCSPSATSSCSGFTGGAGTWDTKEESALSLDSGGWVRSLPASTDTTAKYRYVSAMIFNSNWQQPGTYIVRYDGSGTITYSGAVSKNKSLSTPGRDVLTVTSGDAGLYITIAATNPSNYVRNIRIYPPGGACAGDLTTYAASAADCHSSTGNFLAFENFPTSAVWHPAFLQETKGFRTLRFMDWARTNSSAITDWANRSQYAARSWNTPVGVPIEAMIALSNTVSADPWINVPTHASDDYVHQFARLVHANLASNLTLNLEYSNEPWNYSFPATTWMYNQAKAAWPAEVAAKTDGYILEANWYANRLLQVCNIVKSEFGADKSRVRCVANTQAAVPYMTNAVLNCTVAAKTLGQACGKSIDVVAIAPYFGSYITATKFRPTVSAWYGAADGGLNQMFAELLGTEVNAKAVTPLLAVSSVTGGSLAQVHGWMTAQKAALDKFSIPMWAYEGGQGVVAPAGDTDATLQTLIDATNRDPRMTDVYNQMIADWQASGGQTFTYYEDVSAPGKFGDWGTMVNQFDTAAPKWLAVAKARNAACWWAGC